MTSDTISILPIDPCYDPMYAIPNLGFEASQDGASYNPNAGDAMHNPFYTDIPELIKV